MSEQLSLRQFDKSKLARNALPWRERREAYTMPVTSGSDLNLSSPHCKLKIAVLKAIGEVNQT